ncbi:hypothetical protein E4U42_000703 [Claviceps africana]|uniref:F-box domain-containing protein n=1 Tax=Claviceps africana TaxID=83212 RepID=A0A8K0NKN1_9HYPO|nr:hypothetical protein E4U42_000703 [Claviceps africana]
MNMHQQQQQRLRAISSSTHGSHVDKPNTTSNSTTKANLASLPTELQLAISDLLIYPDALSLKHTSRAFYHLVDTGVELKIDWLVSRRKLHLECPNDRACDLRSDLQFCRGSVAYVHPPVCLSTRLSPDSLSELLGPLVSGMEH